MNRQEAVDFLKNLGYGDASDTLVDFAFKFAKAEKTETPQQAKVHKVMGEYKRGKLHSGTGKKGKKGKIVAGRDQAVAIALSEAGLSKEK